MYIRFLVFPLVEASNCCVFLWIGDSPLLKFVVAAAAVEAQPVGRRRVGLSEAGRLPSTSSSGYTRGALRVWRWWSQLAFETPTKIGLRFPDDRYGAVRRLPLARQHPVSLH